MIGSWDRVRVEELLRNLLSNAVTHGQGAPIAVEVADADDFARVVVVDRGPGIAPEHHERIFQPFARLDPNEQGVGLGLWICRKILRAHRGKIEVQSLPGQGTTMLVMLPRGAPSEPEWPHPVN